MRSTRKAPASDLERSASREEFARSKASGATGSCTRGLELAAPSAEQPAWSACRCDAPSGAEAPGGRSLRGGIACA